MSQAKARVTHSGVAAGQAPIRTEHFDVLIIGAGISGLGSAYHLSHQCPDKTFVILEALESFGGTWLVHRFPGIRSDSDLYTYGYRFKPWVGPAMASGEEYPGVPGPGRRGEPTIEAHPLLPSGVERLLVER